MSFGRWLLFFTYLGLVQAEANSASLFKPSQYPKKTAHCKATRRTPVEEAVDIQLSTLPVVAKCYGIGIKFYSMFIEYVDINPEASTTLIMVHGWPSLWSTWSNQIQEFQVRYHFSFMDLGLIQWNRRIITWLS